MKQIFALIILSIVFSTKSIACLNLYVINERGKEGLYNDHPPYEIYFNARQTLAALKSYEGYIKTAKPEERHEYISDYAVYLVKLGRNKEALQILRKLAAKHPAEYEILANLATAYELNGKPDSALLYMKKSLKLNPDSHNGSEWFHLRFLEATIKVRDQKLSPGDVNVLKLETRTNLIGEEIAHQLAERLPLSGSPNPLLAKALEESADYFRKEISVDWAVKLYAMSIGYTTDEKVIARVWGKIESARARVLALNSKNPKAARRDEVRQALLKKTWKEYINKDIARWRAHKSHYEANLTILSL